MRQLICLILCIAILGNLMGCGTLFYAERKGQTGGQVDTKVALLDGALFLLCIIPGIVAFLIDIDNGTIYLPGGYASLDETMQLAEKMPTLKLQFLNEQEQPLSEIIAIEYVPGTKQVANAEYLRQQAQGAAKVRVYYQDNIFQTVSLPTEPVAK